MGGRLSRYRSAPASVSQMLSAVTTSGSSTTKSSPPRVTVRDSTSDPRGAIHDTLQMFHHWQPDLPAHLQFCAQFVQFPFPWKHLAGTDLEFYGIADVDATLRLYDFLRLQLDRDGIWGQEGCDAATWGRWREVRPVLAAMERPRAAGG